MHSTLWGKRFSIKMYEFATMFKLRGVDEDNQLNCSLLFIHDGNELEDSRMKFLYNRVHGQTMLGNTNGLTPYYKMLNQLFRFTLTPTGGDSNNISYQVKNLLYKMAPSQRRFNVCDFLWSEIIICSHRGSSGCHYAPYIFHMIKHVTQLNTKPNKTHDSYKTKRGKIEKCVRLEIIEWVLNLRYPFLGAYPIEGPGDAGVSSSKGPSQAPSSSSQGLSLGLFHLMMQLIRMEYLRTRRVLGILATHEINPQAHMYHCSYHLRVFQGY
jgi:hypothetical protein